MTFDYKRDIYETGFPVSIFKSNAKILYLIAGPVQNRDADFAFGCNSDGDIYAVGSANNKAAELFVSDSFRIAHLESPAAITSLALVDNDGETGNEMLVAATGKSVYGFSLVEADNTFPDMAKQIFRVNLDHAVNSPVVYYNGKLFIGGSDRTGYSINISNPTEITALSTSSQLNDWVAGYSNFENLNTDIDYAASVALQTAGSLDLIAYQSNANSFMFFDENGENYNQFLIPVSLKGQFALADLDGNGTPDIVFNSGEGIYAFNQQGSLISGFPVKPDFGIIDSLSGAPLLIDIDGSGIPDIISTTSGGQVLSFTEKGKSISDFMLSTGGNLSVSPVILQLDDDQELELMAITDQGNCYVWQLPATGGSGNEWLSENYNASNNILINNFSAYKPVTDALMPESRAYNYPNPNKDNFTKIRYYLNENSNVKIRIFDASGLLIDEFSGPGEGQVDNEIPWDVSSVASGVYLCKIEAKSGSRSESKIIKIMVVH